MFWLVVDSHFIGACGFSQILIKFSQFCFSNIGEDILERTSNQEETDTRVILYLHYASKLVYKSAVVRNPDADIFFITLHHAKKIYLNVYLDF